MKIAIVGAGAAGLFAALLLARPGHEVVVLEQDRLEHAPDRLFRVRSASGAPGWPTTATAAKG